jgi:EAL domain-containing protein (putative c-di-GMP-specific phosphodiesterase class I)
VAIAGPAGVSPEALVRDADAAMYRAKENGRARYEVFDREMRRRAVERLQIEADLRQAIERGELRLLFQPVVTLADGELSGVEALVRWQHPVRGMISPGEFIPVAEDTGLIVPIGQWVLEEACRQAAEWRRENPDAPRPLVSVNLSARQLAEPDLPSVVQAALEESGLEPEILGLELTESMLMEDMDRSVEVTRALRSLGVRIVLDDFGTGYSSLGYIKRFPIDVLKLDRSFVGGLGPGSTDAAIVAAVVSMARELRVSVVAEGVETQDQLDHLSGLGCGYVQGFYFSPPVSPNAIAKMLGGQLPWRKAAAHAAS